MLYKLSINTAYIMLKLNLVFLKLLCVKGYIDSIKKKREYSIQFKHNIIFFFIALHAYNCKIIQDNAGTASCSGVNQSL